MTARLLALPLALDCELEGGDLHSLMAAAPAPRFLNPFNLTLPLFPPTHPHPHPRPCPLAKEPRSLPPGSEHHPPRDIVGNATWQLYLKNGGDGLVFIILDGPTQSFPGAWGIWEVGVVASETLREESKPLGRPWGTPVASDEEGPTLT